MSEIIPGTTMPCRSCGKALLILNNDNTGKPAGTVVQLLQPGYTLHDRLLRPAMVAIARGAPAPTAAPQLDTTA